MTLSCTVETLMLTDLKTLLAAIEQHDLSLLRMSDGSKPTDELLTHIMQATAEDFTAAEEQLHLRMIRAENAMFSPERITKLMVKYGAGRGEALGKVEQRMNADDREELSMLIQLTANDEGVADVHDGS